MADEAGPEAEYRSLRTDLGLALRWAETYDEPLFAYGVRFEKRGHASARTR